MGSLRTVGTLAAVNFFVQAAVWSVLAVLAICAYSCHFQPKGPIGKDSPFRDLAAFYFSDSSCWPLVKGRSRPELTSTANILILASLQLTFNGLLAIISLVLLFVIPRRGSMGFLGWLYAFLTTAVVVCIIDMVTSATFSSDSENLAASPTDDLHPLTYVLPMMSLIAARGFVFWILNFGIILYLFLAATMRMFKACKRLDEARNGQVNRAYEEDERGIPAHTAISRWPGLGRPLDRFQKREIPRQPTEEEYRHQNLQRERSGLGTREELRQRPSFRDAFNYMESKKEGNRVTVSNGALPSARPQSLHEAILTIKPLKQVRPKIPDMHRY